MKKSYFLLSLTGVLLLSACVQDVESESVTKLRDAKAEELASIAAVNNANAEAALLLANAEVAIKQAEAKAIEADAAKTQAEADLLKVNAELAAVDVQLAEVRLESAQVELEQKKVQLEAEKVKLEADIAESEKRKAQAAADLEKLAIEIQAANLRAQADLMRAQVEYNDAAARLESNTSVDLVSLANNYYSISQDLLDAQSTLAGLQVQLAQAQSNLVSLGEMKAAAIVENNNDIAYLKVLIANLEAKKGKSEAELRTAWLEALSEQSEASLAAEAALNTFNDAVSVKNDALSDLGRYEFVSSSLDDFSGIDNVTVYSGSIIGADGESTYGYYFYDENGEQVPLYIPYKRNPVVEIYPESTFAPEPAVETDWYEKTVVIPAVANAQGYASLIALEKAAIQEQYDDNKEMYGRTLENLEKSKVYYEKDFAVMNPILERYQTDYDAALVASEQAYEKFQEASDAANEYYYDNITPERAEIYEKLKVAQAEYDEVYNYYYELKEAYRSNYYYYYGSDSEEKAYVEGRIKYFEERVAEANFNLRNAQAQAEADGLTAAQTALAEAQEAVIAQEAVVAEAYAAYETAQEAETTAKIIYWNDPTPANQTSYNNAVIATQTAEDNYNAALLELTNLQGELNTAQSDYDVIIEPVNNAQAGLDYSQDRLDWFEAMLPEIEAVIAADEACAPFMQTINDLYAEESALYSDEQYQAVYQARDDAWNEYVNSISVENEAEAALEQALRDVVSYVDYNPDYTSYSDILSEYDSVVEDIENVKETLVELETEYNENIASLDEKAAEYTAVLATESLYTAGVAEFEKLDEAALEAFKAMIDADAALSLATAEASAAALALDEEIDLEEDIAEIEAMIAELEADNADVSEIEEKEDAIALLQKKIEIQQAVVNAYEKTAAEAKEALDAAMGTGSSN